MNSKSCRVVFFCSLFAACGSVRAGDKLPVVDLSGETNRHAIVAAGTEDVYQGHPTTAMTSDGRIIAVWCTPHGGWCGPAAESSDGGKSWTRIDGRFPEGFRHHVNCPSIYRLAGPDGKARIWVWSQTKMPPDSKDHLDRRWRGNPMPSVMSEDEGRTWKEMPPLGKKFRCVMAFSSIVQLKDGSHLGLFHVRSDGRDAPPLGVYQTITKDGGFTWSDPVCIALVEGKSVCEPYVFRSPKGDELCCIMRENLRTGNSMVMFSRDEGKTWTTPEDAPWGLTGDRHQGVQLPDGRMVIAFRDMAPKSPTRGHFVAWVGPYDAIKSRETEGTYRVKLLHNYATVDCGYPGIHLLPDGTILATTYLKYWNDKRLQSVVSTRFRIEETDRFFAALESSGDVAESSARRVVAKDSWHGFDREVFEFNGCEAWIVEPKAAADGRPWVWIMEWPDAFAKRTGSVALLKAGYHVVTLRPGHYEKGRFVPQPGNMNDRRLRESRAFQKYLVDALHFAPKANLIGMSWGGFYSVRYAGTYPDAVSRIYLDAPLLDFSTAADKARWGLNEKYGVDAKTYVGRDDPRQPVNMYEPIAKAGIPILLLYGGADATVPPSENCLRFAEAFKAAGGDIEIVARGHYGHHPHGLEIDEQQRFVDFFSGKSARR